MTDTLRWEDAWAWLASASVGPSTPTSLLDLASLLQDGQMLCDLANRIQPSTIASVNRLCSMKVSRFLRRV